MMHDNKKSKTPNVISRKKNIPPLIGYITSEEIKNIQSKTDKLGERGAGISFFSFEHVITSSDWKCLKNKAQQYEIDLCSLFLNSLIPILERWSSQSSFLVETSILPSEEDLPFAEQVLIVQKTPWITITKYIEEQLQNEIRAVDAENSIPISIRSNLWTMPQVENDEKGLLCSIVENDRGITVCWEVDSRFFEERKVHEMFTSWISLLDWLQDEEWEKPLPDILPVNQREVRNSINNTQIPIVKKTLHHDFFLQPTRNIALQYYNEEGNYEQLTYEALAHKVLSLAATLQAKGVKKGDLVGITIPRGPNQIIAVMGIVSIGAAYVPIGVNQPISRQRTIHQIGEIKHVVVTPEHEEKIGYPAIQTISVTDLNHGVFDLTSVDISTDELAYVIFTSGSTGAPKGVEITHEAAYNTIQDINKRFLVTEKDKALALSALDFDLSVYDIFGLLSVGGSLVLLSEQTRREATIWREMIERHKVTLWNSVPALLEMLLISNVEKSELSSLRLAMVSGDWVGLDLLERLEKVAPQTKLFALGGATEAAIWSNVFPVTEVASGWKSIPYGTPLENQCYRVVDSLGRDRPNGVPGELWIGGSGVARGYLGNPKLTAERFIVEGEQRWYRTGDLGRYWENGTLEFLGREDRQVKLRGYRIELGEIEVALKKNEGIDQAIASVVSREQVQHLVAAVVSTLPQGTVSSEQKGVSGAIQKFRQKEITKQSEVIEMFLYRLLKIDNLLLEKEQWNPIATLDISEEHHRVVQMWMEWLLTRELLYLEGNSYKPGKRFYEVYEKVSEKLTEKTENDSSLLVKVGAQLGKRILDYKAILAGKLEAAVLLDDAVLSPEYLSVNDPGTIKGIDIIAEKIKKLSFSKKRPVRVAVLGGRTGVMTVRLAKQLTAEEMHCTLLDTAPSMIAMAKQNLREFSSYVDCQKIHKNNITEAYRYHFDIVLAINALHRYECIDEGLGLATLLVNNGGKILALEHAALSPIAMVTSSILDRGYVDFEYERKVRYNPMLTGKQWSEFFVKKGLLDVQYEGIPDSFTEIIEAQSSEDRKLLFPNSILEELSCKLPEHMIPEQIAILPVFPLTSNGKIDRLSIAESFDFQEEISIEETPEEGVETEIASMWQELLQVTNIGRNHSFFKIGGDSLLATRFLAMVKERYEIELSLRAMFETPELKDVAAIIKDKYSELCETMELMEEGEI